MELIEILLSACQSEDVSLVQELLGKDYLLDTQDNEGVTPLQMACAHGQNSVVELLLAKGAEVNLANHFGWTPLMHTLFNGHTDTARLLIHNRADVTTPTKLGLTPLSTACAGGNISCVRLLLETEPLSGLQTQHGEFGAILTAALHGHEDVIKLLLDHDMNINHVDSVTKLTALMLAASSGQRPCVQLLVEHGADTNLTSVCHRTALDVASACGKWEVKAYLGDKTINSIGNENYDKEREAPIFVAIKQNNVKELNRILEQDPDACNRVDHSTGSTPLMEASILGATEIAAILLKRGANTDAQDTKEGWTALMHAVSQRKPNIVSLLLDNGASVEINRNKGCTALDLLWVTDSGNRELIDLFSNWKRPTKNFLSVSDHSPNSSSLKHTSKSTILRRSFRNSSFGAWMSSRFYHPKRSRSSTSLSAMSPTDVASDSEEDKNVFFEKDNSLCNSPQNSKTHTATPLVKLSSFQWPKKSSEPQRDWSRKQVNPPLLPSPSKWHNPISKEHLPPFLPKRSTPVKAFCPVHLMKKYHSWKKNCISSRTNVQRMTNPPYPSMPDSSSREDCGHVSNESNRDGESQRDVPPMSPPINLNGSYKGLRCRQWNEGGTSSIESHWSGLQNGFNPEADALAIEEVEVPSHINTRTADEMENLLRHLSLERYVPKFQEHEMDLEALKSVTEEDLQEIGVLSLGPKQQLMNAISQL